MERKESYTLETNNCPKLIITFDHFFHRKIFQKRGIIIYVKCREETQIFKEASKKINPMTWAVYMTIGNGIRSEILTHDCPKGILILT
jgi:hypothetical protein